MITKQRAVAVAKAFAKSRHDSWDDNNYSAIKVNFAHEPCWKVSVISGNETGAQWYEIVSGTPVDYYISMTTGHLIAYRIARGAAYRCSYNLED